MVSGYNLRVGYKARFFLAVFFVLFKAKYQAYYFVDVFFYELADTRHTSDSNFSMRHVFSKNNQYVTSSAEGFMMPE